MKKINQFGMEFEVSDYGMVKFDREKPVATVQIPKQLTANDVDSIICTAIEGGISYWAGVNNTGVQWEQRPKGICLSEWITILLLAGHEVEFYDVEDKSEKWTLSLAKLMLGYVQNCMERPHDCDIEQGDATTADCIIQYALFETLVYG